MRAESTTRPLAAIAISVAASWPGAAYAADLNLIPDFTIVAANVLLFVVLIYPVNRLLVRPLLAVLDERERRTAGATDEAERLRDEARAHRTELEARVAEARGRAQARRAAILADTEAQERTLLDAARGEAVRTIETVRRGVDAELASARAALRGDATGLAREAASRILGRAL